MLILLLAQNLLFNFCDLIINITMYLTKNNLVRPNGSLERNEVSSIYSYFAAIGRTFFKTFLSCEITKNKTTNKKQRTI